MRDLHMHTVFSDGKNTPEEMVQEAIRLGLDTVGISDHSHLDPCGMTLETSVEYRAEIARLKQKYACRTAIMYPLTGPQTSSGKVWRSISGETGMPLSRLSMQPRQGWWK